MERARFTQNLFEDMALLYKTGNIAQICLSLQHEFAADVPVFLICLMADHAELSLTEATFDAWIASGAAWYDTVIRPLRKVRTTLKEQQVTGDASAFRERIKSIELEAERLHVEALAATFLSAAEGPENLPSLAARYLHLIGVPEAEIAPKLQALAAERTAGKFIP
jgi:uncharacterized protein (TIGR02444 family)